VTESAAVDPTEQEPFTIRSAVRLQVVHALQGGDLDRTAEADGAYDPAHRASPGWLSVRIRRFHLPKGGSPCGDHGESIVTDITQEACRMAPLSPRFTGRNRFAGNEMRNRSALRRRLNAAARGIGRQTCGTPDTAAGRTSGHAVPKRHGRRLECRRPSTVSPSRRVLSWAR